MKENREVATLGGASSFNLVIFQVKLTHMRHWTCKLATGATSPLLWRKFTLLKIFYKYSDHSYDSTSFMAQTQVKYIYIYIHIYIYIYVHKNSTGANSTHLGASLVLVELFPAPIHI